MYRKSSIGQDFSDYLYSRLPSVYRTSDKEEILKRFIECFSDGGFTPLMQDTLDIMDLLDVDKCPSKFLPRLCQMYGYEYTLEIPELFQRRLLKYIVEMYKRKGTKSVVRFIARELTGFDSEITENKDFDEEQVRITKWDKKFENYRNFILKLTAPYEDSNLFNKEEIVVKILKDFLPTNSQVFVITAYWFKAESEIVKKSIMNTIHEAVKDYTGDIHHRATQKTLLDKDNTSMSTKDNCSYAFYGEEDSYLNYPIEGMLLTTNVVLKVRDKVTIAKEIYNVVLNQMETLETNILVLQEGELRNLISKYNYVETRNKIKSKETQEDYNKNIVQNILNTIRTLVDLETKPINLFEERDKFPKVKLNDDFILRSSIVGTDYDIIKKVDDTYTYTTYFKQGSNENSKLNETSGLFTNGIIFYDIIKEKGKPDKFILY